MLNTAPDAASARTGLALSRAAAVITVAACIILTLLSAGILLSGPARLRVSIGRQVIEAAAVMNKEAQIRGLSGSKSLPDGQAMLFIFDRPDYWQFWMKDMNYNLDIVWLNSDKRVVYLARNVPVDSFPLIYRPSAPAQYVLELPAGYSARHHIVPGTPVSFDL